ncbi:putative peroxin-3 family protein [Botrytis fragariae]|uniref:Putative peroxin-3 family protein n=1 Tax=Botrytis fragariae TaxID=1964551 RepID=A0A8H6B4U6_9HELO|nr:putative peroxin-3 family protein [Botrytis fragariae]KAF5879250.1 putative peroxin-3 family protein [Botrytis fragariae]
MNSLRKWARRNRTPLAIGFGVIGVGYVATHLRRRFEQNQEDCTYTVLALLPTATENILAELKTERITDELQQQKAAKQARNGADRRSDWGSSPPSITDDDGRSMVSFSDSGMHISQLGIPSGLELGVDGAQDGGQQGEQQAQKIKRSKMQLWNDLKISSITRSFTLIYTLSLLTLLTRIQLNLLGRRSYLSSVVSLATGGVEQSTISLENNDDDNSDQAYGNDFETNRRYLTFSWWLLHRGWRDVMFKVEAAVKEVFKDTSIREELTMAKFSELTLEVRKKVEGATPEDRQATRWLQYLLPPRDQEDFVIKESGMKTMEPETPSSSLRLLDETSDLIDSPPFSHVLTMLLDAGFSTLVEQKIAQQSFKIPSQPEDARVTEIVEPNAVKLPLILAVLTRQAHSIGNGVPNEYLQAMEQVRELEAFAAVVYSSHENEINPIDDFGSAVLVPKNGLGESEMTSVASNGQDSLIDVGTASRFESAWGKAVDPADKVTSL